MFVAFFFKVRAAASHDPALALPLSSRLLFALVPRLTNTSHVRRPRHCALTKSTRTSEGPLRSPCGQYARSQFRCCNSPLSLAFSNQFPNHLQLTVCVHPSHSSTADAHPCIHPRHHHARHCVCPLLPPLHTQRERQHDNMLFGSALRTKTEVRRCGVVAGGWRGSAVVGRWPLVVQKNQIFGTALAQ